MIAGGTPLVEVASVVGVSRSTLYRQLRPAGDDGAALIIGVSDDPLVSSDIIGDPRAAVVDLDLTRVVDGTLAKVLAWYDNEGASPR